MLHALRTSLGRLRPRLQRSLFFRILDARRGGLHSADIPLVFTDARGIRFVQHPWDPSPIRARILRGEDQAQYEAMAALVRPGDTVFDVGAHLGFHAVTASRLVGPSGRVYAFEPAPQTYWQMRETLALNRCGNVTPVQAALSDTVGTAAMTLYGAGESGWNSLGHPQMETIDGTPVAPEGTAEVETDTLDHFTQAHGIAHIHFLKIDVEGFEKFAFLGAARLLAERRIDYVCFEISQAPLQGAGVTAREVFAVLEAQGYQCYRYDEGSRTFAGPVHDSQEHFANYYASPRDLTAPEGKPPSLEAADGP